MATGLSAQKPVELPLWPNGAPNDNGLKGEEVMSAPYRLTNVTQPTITVYRPATPNGMTIIMCPGGAYALLAMDHEGHDMAPWFNSLGITYVVLKYRMPNGHCEVPLSDAEQAIRIVRKHAKDWNIRTDRVGIMGASAGGHLASTLATHFSSEDTRPDFQILLYPVITMESGHPRRITPQSARAGRNAGINQKVLQRTASDGSHSAGFHHPLFGRRRSASRQWRELLSGVAKA